MSYSICGLIFYTKEETVCLKQELPFFTLMNGVSLVPMDRDYLFLVEGDLTKAGELSDWRSPDWLLNLTSHFSCSAYIEAESWGGSGMQAFVICKEGKVAFGPTIAGNAINLALRKLGISEEPVCELYGLPLIVGKDPFDMVGLGRFRSVGAWLTACREVSSTTRGQT